MKWHIYGFAIITLSDPTFRVWWSLLSLLFFLGVSLADSPVYAGCLCGRVGLAYPENSENFKGSLQDLVFEASLLSHVPCVDLCDLCIFADNTRSARN
ncbi:hypothetical protein Nepgr_022850 [Nepenthes gracilis]|uniref:Secreted protein n=1 Tax=Nepenthes gracilis TaxID=150966 RepID=A0AAD3T119_NEPGR|nr:hypothetical protein Nepgr_022850 [Nepenthes gracilis]